METFKKVLVTGASGYIGRNFLRVSGLKGFKCISLGRSTSPNYDNVTTNFIGRVGSVLHLAGISEDSLSISVQDYEKANVLLTKRMWELFISSNAKNFIYLSSIKALSEGEEHDSEGQSGPNNTSSSYGKSKLEAENFLLKAFRELPEELRANRNLYIIRPCLVYGNDSKGNLKSLFKLVKKGIPYPLAAYENEKSFCSLNNLLEVIFQLINKDCQGVSKVFSVCDDGSISTNELLVLAARAADKKVRLINVPKFLVESVAKLGTVLKLPFNWFILNKLISSQRISNQELLDFLEWENMPYSGEAELIKLWTD